MREILTLGGGCFWCTEAILLQLKGVQSVVSGYAGGQSKNPTYEQVCTGKTGHAEVVQVTFDNEILSLHDLLIVFFTLHNPTTLNRQGNDVGTQYRSAIFFANDEQKNTTEAVMREITEQKVWDAPLVTTLEPFTEFFPAEDYHQNYFAENKNQPYCQIVIAPKVAKLRKLFLDKLQS